MSKKDPAFLLYSERWFRGTASLMPDEKGVYIDLLIHQHRDNSLPNDTKRLARMVGLGEPEFLSIWQTLKSKFELTDDDRLVNRTMQEITTERLTKSRTNKVIGTFAAVLRMSKISASEKEFVKKEFDYHLFMDFKDISDLTERLTDWYVSRLAFGSKSITNTIIDTITPVDIGNGSIESNSELTKVEEGKWNTKPNGKQIDLKLPEIKVGAVIQLFKFSKNTDINESQVESLWNVFKIQNFNGVKYYAEPSDVYSHFINWANKPSINIQTINNGTYKQPTSGKSAGAEKLLGKLKDELGTNQFNR